MRAARSSRQDGDQARRSWPMATHTTSKSDLIPSCGLGKALRVLGALLLGWSAIGCEPEDSWLSAISAERWRIAGLAISERREGKPRDDWIAVFDFGERTITRLLPDNAAAPDGWKPIRLHCVGYSEPASTLVCLAWRRVFCEVWVHDTQSGEAHWVGHKQWKGTSNFAWSPDGRQVAFTAASFRGGGKPRRADLCVYGLGDHTLRVVADDALVAQSALRTPAPVWSEDGRHLYYASIGQDGMRVEVATLAKERIPIEAFAVLTVRGDEIVYVTQVCATYGLGGKIEIMKAQLSTAGTEVGQVLYEGVWLWVTAVSPSRRFLFFTDKTDYFGGHHALLDLDTGRVHYGVGRYLPDRFDVMSTCAVETPDGGAAPARRSDAPQDHPEH